MRRTLLIVLLGLAALLFPSAALAAAPTVTLTNPADGALITGGQPTFSGAAADSPAATGVVAINVYAGSDVGSVPVEAVQAPVSNGTYSAKPNTPLSDGTYTAVATEGDGAGNTGSSATVTFDVFNGSPSITLTAPASPIPTPSPTFTGTAATSPGAGQSVALVIYPGTSTDSTPVAIFSGTVQSNGSFSIQLLPGLADGTYTAVATQQMPVGAGFSADLQFQIATTAPGLTVYSPSNGGTEPQTGVSFSGTAGNEWGDGAQIHLSLYHGATAAGKPVGTATVNRFGAVWNDQWASTLAVGTYTLVVSQTDVVGATTTVTRTFKVAPPGSITGSVKISTAGKVSATLSCLTGAGTCNGDVLILTKPAFRPQPGGPVGPLSLMFARYSVASGKKAALSAKLTPAQLKALRRAGKTRLVVIVAYSVGSKLTEAKRTTAPVKVG